VLRVLGANIETDYLSVLGEPLVFFPLPKGSRLFSGAMITLCSFLCRYLTFVQRESTLLLIISY
jgi:hypothetical protein